LITELCFCWCYKSFNNSQRCCSRTNLLGH